MGKSIKDILNKLRKYEVQIRKDVNAQLQGNFSSIFKGSGIEFDDIRPYQYGDDIRAINWNVSAKGDGTYIKTFREEKEQTVFFYIDVSASQKIKSKQHSKIDIAKEIAGVLTLSAIKETSQVGLLCFSDQRELYMKPKKGASHAYGMIGKLFNTSFISKNTDLKKGFSLLFQLLKRKSMLIIISDFIDTDYEKNLKALAQKHDVIVIHINDEIEGNLPNIGIVPVLDKESNKTIWLNSSFSKVSKTFKKEITSQRAALETLCKRQRINYLHLNTNEDFVPQLISLFKIRNRA